MAEHNLDVNMFTSPYQLTKSLQRDTYPTVDPSNPSLSAAGKVVIITGAGGGVGAAIARAWAQAGAAGIVLAGRNQATLDKTVANVQEISPTIPTVAQPTDTSDEKSVQALFATVKAKFGKAHVLVNAAGTMGGGLVGEVPVASWWGDFEVNVKGFFLTVQAFIQNFDAEGTVLNFVSTAVTMAFPGISSYASSKLATIKVAELLGVEYPKLRVFSVHPGLVEAADRGMVVDAFTPFAKDTQRLSGGVSLWLATPDADFLKGGFLSVNWDVDELKSHASEVTSGGLNQLAFLKGQLGPAGHPWTTV